MDSVIGVRNLHKNIKIIMCLSIVLPWISSVAMILSGRQQNLLFLLSCNKINIIAYKIDRAFNCNRIGYVAR